MSDIFLIDAIGPFFRGYQKKRINWSKIHFSHIDPLDDEQWENIYRESQLFAQHVSKLGYTAVSLDDLAHLTVHSSLGPALTEQNTALQKRFKTLFSIYEAQNLDVYLTTDVLPLTASIRENLGNNHAALNEYYERLVEKCFSQMPELAGLIMRIGESDGLDVKDPILTQLHLKTAKQTNAFLKTILPIFENAQKNLILRTWTVGAHSVGDLIWHRSRIEQAFSGVESENFIISMKHGESDFFRYLPVNKAFFQLPQKKIIELQARREYEGAGEYPSYIGWECQRYANELVTAKNIVGMSVWCQTGGWHGFSRRAFLSHESDKDIWIKLNCAAAIDIFRYGKSPEESISAQCWDESATTAAIELLHLSDIVMRDLFYIPQFARQKLFFRRVRIPPLLHVYWDCIFIISSVRKLIRHFVKDHDEALASGEAALELFPRMSELAEKAGFPVDDIHFMRDSFTLIAMARRYYFSPYDPELIREIKAAKKAYKLAWPRTLHSRYRIKTDFSPFKVKRRTLAWGTGLLLRRKRGYRLVDRLFTLNLLSLFYRVFTARHQKAFPKFIRESAMGIDTLFK